MLVGEAGVAGGMGGWGGEEVLEEDGLGGGLHGLLLSDGREIIGVIPCRGLVGFPRQIAAVDAIVAEEGFPTFSQMSELYFLYFYHHILHLAVTMHHQPIVCLVVEMCRPAYVVK